MAHASDESKNDELLKQALEIWESGTRKEKEGSMMDAIKCYRAALKVSEDVEYHYRTKIRQELQREVEQNEEVEAKDIDYTNNNDDSDPCWLLEILPNDLLFEVVKTVVRQSGEDWVNLAMTCKLFNKLCFDESMPYEIFAKVIYSKQIYDAISLDLNGITDIDDFEIAIWNRDYRNMINTRPYVKFEGIYISVVNYIRYGSNVEGTTSLLNPVHIVTYYRYYRFYEDGTCLRLVSTDEPSMVVKSYSKTTMPKHSNICYWKLGLEDYFSHLYVTRDSEKYSFVEKLQITNQGPKKHHRLKWLESIAIDSEGNITQSSLKNEKPFHFSRVRSFAK